MNIALKILGIVILVDIWLVSFWGTLISWYVAYKQKSIVRFMLGIFTVALIVLSTRSIQYIWASF